jgi:heat shock protein HslJ
MRRDDGWRLLLVLIVGALLLAGCRQTADLGGTEWELVAYGPADAPIPAEAPAWISFEDNGRMGGSIGCNSFSGNYEAEDGRLILGDEIAFTAMGCDQDPQEAFFRAWLGDETYTQTADRLTLVLDEGRQVAEYQLRTNNE